MGSASAPTIAAIENAAESKRIKPRRTRAALKHPQSRSDVTVSMKVVKRASLLTRNLGTHDGIVACLAGCARLALQGHLDPKLLHSVANVCNVALRTIESKGTSAGEDQLLVRLKTKAGELQLRGAKPADAAVIAKALTDQGATPPLKDADARVVEAGAGDTAADDTPGAPDGSGSGADASTGPRGLDDPSRRDSGDPESSVGAQEEGRKVQRGALKPPLGSGSPRGCEGEGVEMGAPEGGRGLTVELETGESVVRLVPPDEQGSRAVRDVSEEA